MSELKELTGWKEQIQRGLAARKQDARDEHWQTYDDYYEGRHQGADLIMNQCFAQIRAMIPRVYFRNPGVTVTPRTPMREPHARVVEVVANYLALEMELKREIKAAILDAAITGTGLLKLGYDSEYGFKPEAAVPGTSETLTSRDEQFRRLEYSGNVRPGRPWAKRADPADVVIDPAVTNIADAQWVAYRYRRLLSDVKKDDKFSGTRDLAPTHIERLRQGEEETMHKPGLPWESNEELAEYVELWEVSDKKTERVYVFALQHDKFLMNESDVLQIDGLPWVPIVFNPRRKSPWGISDVEVIMPQQKELNQIRSLQKAYRKFNVIRFLVRAGAISPEQLQKLLSEEPIAHLEVDADAGKLQDIIQMLQTAVPTDMPSWSLQIESDIRNLLGQGSNQMGQYETGPMGGSGRRTATEASIVQSNVQMRADERRDTVADAVETVIRRCMQMVFKWWTTPQVARIVGPLGMVYWVQYTGPELKAEYDFQITADDSMPVSAEVRRQQALMLLQTVGPIVAQGGGNLGELLRHALLQFPEINTDAVIGPEIMPPGAPMNLGQLGMAMSAPPPQPTPPMPMPAAAPNPGAVELPPGAAGGMG